MEPTDSASHDGDNSVSIKDESEDISFRSTSSCGNTEKEHDDPKNITVDSNKEVCIGNQNLPVDDFDSQLTDNSNQLAANSILSESKGTTQEEKEPSLEDLATSDFIHNRQLAAKSILKFLQQAGSDEEAILSVISMMCKLSVDEEFMVRSELVDNFLAIALFCKSRPEDLGTVITQLVVPCTVKLFTDEQIQVRRMGHMTFCRLLEQNIIDRSHLSGWICPLISELVLQGNISEELKIEDVSMMCRMIPHISKDLIVKFFLEPFIHLSFSSVLNIRRVCAATFGTLSKKVGQDITETIILPAFLERCSDEDIEVIKYCIVVFADISHLVCDRTRKEVLSPMFITLLNDNSHLVQEAAYRNLGDFISTFAVFSFPSDHECAIELLEEKYKSNLKNINKIREELCESTKENYNHELNISNENELNIIKITKNTNDLNLMSVHNCCKVLNDKSTFSKNSFHLCDENSNFNSNMFLQNSPEENPFSPDFKLPLSTESEHLSCPENENLYNNFQYWRMPLPEIADLDIQDVEDCIHTTTDLSKSCENCPSDQVKPVSQFLKNLISKRAKDYNVLFNEDQKKLQEEVAKTDWISKLPPPLNKRIVFYTRMGSEINLGPGIYSEMVASDQDIVPPDLLDKYISIVVTTCNTKDGAPAHCALNFPNVASTLGKKNWPIIRRIHSMLAKDITYAVRKTVASNLHILVDLLDHDDIVKDIVPIYINMLKDVDAVRIKSLTNLESVLLKLKPDERQSFLPLIKSLLVIDCERNWRFRYTVAKELLPCVKLFNPTEVNDNFLCIPLEYLSDKVSNVRMAGIDLMAEIIKSTVNKEIKFLLHFLDTKYRQANKWLKRQTYILLCEEVAAKSCLPTDLFVEKMAANLLLLAHDKVPNVRLALSRCLTRTLLPLGYVSIIKESSYSDLLLQALYSLQSDSDKDVRYFAQLHGGLKCLSKSSWLPEDAQNQ